METEKITPSGRSWVQLRPGEVVVNRETVRWTLALYHQMADTFRNILRDITPETEESKLLFEIAEKHYADAVKELL